MTLLRSLPPVIAAVALAVGAAGCGSDDPTTTAAEPVGTAAAAPATTTAAPEATTPAATTAAPSATTAPGVTTAPDPVAAQGTRGTTTGAAPAPSTTPLSAYARGGRPASAAQARAVRGSFGAFARAIADRDAKGLCSRTVGFEALLKAQGGGVGSCEELFKNIGNGAAGPSTQDLRLIDDADVVVADDHATLSLGGQTPVPMRRVDGTWKVDYAAFAATPVPKG